ncbi:MAG: biotin/lipoyl-binding protein [Oleiphilaceae bacterium]|nr:biotin/lipoyl-binding protein [Oleiphilaceae bacterium]
MDILIIMTYIAICIAISKIFKIPMNKWTVPTAVLGGIAIVATLMMVMNYNHPYAKYAKEAFVTVPIVPQVSGIVETVNITPNVAVKQGNILYTIENSAQQIALKKAEAALADA